MMHKALLVDPPWSFKTYSDKGKGRSAERHYNTLSIDDIKALPIANLSAEDSVLFLWVTMPLLDVGIETGKAWGFSYKTCAFTWVKTYGNKMFWSDQDIFMGMGYWTRSNTELCLLFTRGHPKRLAANVQQVVVAPVTRHSKKPDCIYDRIESLVDGPYVEVFARQTRVGWHSIGNEIDGRDIREVLT